MASGAPEEAGRLPRLHLYHDGGTPDARQTGLILDRVANAFRTYSQLVAIEQPGRLVVEEIRSGSLFAYLQAMFDVGSAVLTIYEHREFLAGFVTQFIDGLKLMQAHEGPPPLPAFRMAIEAMSAPVRSSRANRLTFNVEGDNNRIFVIDADAAAVVQIFLDAQPRPARGRYDDTRSAEVALRALPVTTDRRTRSFDASSERHTVAKGRQFAEEIDQMLLPKSRRRGRAAPESLPSGGVGTLLSLGGIWLVRPEGYSGGLFPVDPATVDIAALKSNANYLVQGHVSDGRYAVVSLKELAN